MAEVIYAQFRFEQLSQSWHRLESEEQARQLGDLQGMLTRHRSVLFDTYFPLPASDPQPGMTAPASCDFLVRLQTTQPEGLGEWIRAFHELDFARHCDTVTFTGKTREPRYSEDFKKDLAATAPPPTLKRHAFLWCITRKADWDHLPEATRLEVVHEHIRRELHYNPLLHRRQYECRGLDTAYDVLYYVESTDPGAVEEAYERTKSLRIADYWARHDLAFHGVPVTLEEWCEQLIKGHPGAMRFNPKAGADQPQSRDHGAFSGPHAP